jgi:hypothetical protein
MRPKQMISTRTAWNFFASLFLNGRSIVTDPRGPRGGNGKWASAVPFELKIRQIQEKGAFLETFEMAKNRHFGGKWALF